MAIANLEERLRRAEETLTRVAQGDFEQKLEILETDDALSGLEMGINFMVVDLRQIERVNREQRDALVAQQRELEGKLVTIEQQAAAIRELSTPIMEIWDDVLVLPIVGVVDTSRSMDIMTHLLEQLTERQSRCVIIDITGVEIVDARSSGTMHWAS